MMTQAKSEDYGHAVIDPSDDVIAGQYGTWRIIYQAGASGVAVGGSLRVYTDSDTDWELPQLIDPEACDYLSVDSPPGVHVDVRIDSQRAVRLLVGGRDLEPGEQLTLVYGDTSHGAAGSRAQTFVEEKRYFWIKVDARGDGNLVTLPNPPYLSIVGDQPVKLVVIAPSTVVIGQSFRVIVKAEDQWGNPVKHYRGSVLLSGQGLDLPEQARNLTFAGNDCGVRCVEGLAARQGGLLRIEAADSNSGLQAQSNPIMSSKARGRYQLHWADPHGGQVVLNSKFGDFFRHARDVAGVQFVGFQRNADVISDEDWEVQQREERRYYEPGRFVPIPGFEWSGRTWEGGHHNIYFRRHHQPARRNLPVEEMFHSDRARAELAHILDVYRLYRNTDVIITPHVGGEHSDLTYHEPTLEPAVEIVSSHGMFEWMLRDALARGYKLGFLGGSDSYTGRPGDDRPGFQTRRYSKAGLTGIYVDNVTLESFHEAMRARRVYATTGARMILHSQADGYFMGSEYATSSAPTITASIVGTAPLESVELFRGLDRIYTVPLDQRPLANRIRLLWRGASRKTSYAGVVWDGVLTVRGSHITGVSTLRFDSPRSRIIEQTATTVRWHAWGCGYPSALLLNLDNPTGAVINIAVAAKTITGPSYGGHGSRPPRRISFAPAESARLTASVDELHARGRVELDLGVLDRRLEISLAKEQGPTTAELEFTDDAPNPGVNPYWIRVVQSDLEFGWTSPVYADYCPPVR